MQYTHLLIFQIIFYIHSKHCLKPILITLFLSSGLHQSLLTTLFFPSAKSQQSLNWTLITFPPSKFFPSGLDATRVDDTNLWVSGSGRHVLGHLVLPIITYDNDLCGLAWWFIYMKRWFEDDVKKNFFLEAQRQVHRINFKCCKVVSDLTWNCLPKHFMNALNKVKVISVVHQKIV